MWCIDPKLLCRKHLLGEHGELHKFRHNFVKKHNMNKRIELGQIDPVFMGIRHDELAKEIENRGYNHNSPYEQPDVNYIPDILLDYCYINIEQNMQELKNRCPECRKRIEESEVT
jgi:hypothetical protein